MRAQRSICPEPFASVMSGRDKRQLGEAFGLWNFGVNLTTPAPGAMSALRDAHSHQDEFVYIFEGEAAPELATPIPEKPDRCPRGLSGNRQPQHGRQARVARRRPAMARSGRKRVFTHHDGCLY